MADHNKDDEKLIPEDETKHQPAEVEESAEAEEEKTSKDEERGEEPTPDDKPPAHPAPKGSALQRAWHWMLGHKLVSIPLIIVVLLAALFAVPVTRYSALGLFVRQDFGVVIVDSQTGKPVSSATVTLKDKSAKTDSQGRATLHVSVGEARLSITKTYYKSAAQEVVVPLNKPAPLTVKFQATGHPVPLTVLNSVSGQPLPGATISAENTQAKTDNKGQTVLVVPANKEVVKGTVTADGYNKAEVTIGVTTQGMMQTVSLTPAGKIYLLSNQSGKIDLIKTNLDGTERQTVLAGTGKEDKFGTVLLASRDWKYIALLSRRDGGDYAKLFLIEAGTDKVTTMDEGDATFGIYGWSGSRFVYGVTRAKLQPWQSKRQAIKSYDASAKKLTTILETTAEGDQYDYAYETIDIGYVLDQEVAYVKSWSGGPNYSTKLQGKQTSLNSVKADGSQKKTIKSYATDYIETRTGDFGEIYIRYNDGGNTKIDKYQQGKLTITDQKEDDFYNETYPAYSVSPSGKKTLWSDYRDGKNVFFVGDENGENGQEIGSSEDFTPYGWYSDDYILLTKKSIEMRIMPAAGLSGDLEKSLKISNYYKPNYYLRGFGYGYGG